MKISIVHIKGWWGGWNHQCTTRGVPLIGQHLCHFSERLDAARGGQNDWRSWPLTMGVGRGGWFLMLSHKHRGRCSCLSLFQTDNRDKSNDDNRSRDKQSPRLHLLCLDWQHLPLGTAESCSPSILTGCAFV